MDEKAWELLIHDLKHIRDDVKSMKDDLSSDIKEVKTSVSSDVKEIRKRLNSVEGKVIALGAIFGLIGSYLKTKFLGH